MKLLSQETNLLMGSFADVSAVKSTKYYILIFKNNTVKVGRINLMSPYNQKLRIFPVTFLLASFTLIKFVLFFLNKTRIKCSVCT